MQLKNLLKDINVLSCDGRLLEKDVKDIKINSKEVKHGDLFIALKGGNVDGNKFLPEVLSKGAIAVTDDKNFCGDGVVLVDNARSAYALSSKHFFGDACDDLRLIAITGTNGKTTTSWAISNLLKSAGAKVGTIGTLGVTIGDRLVESGFTTPDPYDLHKYFALMKKEGREFVVMEASAHALALNKLDGIKFEIGMLTNITEDHLDFFGDMDNYARAKFKLFQSDKIKLGIVCSGKDYLDQLRENATVPLIYYGIDAPCEVKASNCQKSITSSKFDCDFMGDKFPINTPLVGGYNIENSLGAIAVARSLGLSKDIIQYGMSTLPQVEGRFNVIKMNGVNIVIDFAHTPDGLQKVLENARELTDGKLITIFGCGGNRDKLKRPIMGKIASSISDEVVLTNDNPRFERPMDIISEIQRGIEGGCRIIPSRREAIESVLSSCSGGETVVIAGKGGEKTQSIMGRDYPYNDFDVVYDFYRRKIKDIKNENLEDFEEVEQN